MPTPLPLRLAPLLLLALALPARAQKVPDLRLDAGDAAGQTQSWFPQIAAVGDSVHVAWEDSRSGAPDLYYRRSLDGGNSWEPELRLDIGSLPGSSASTKARLIAVGTTVHVAWLDERSGLADVYIRSSLDNGASFGPEIRLDSSSPAGSGNSDLPMLHADGAHVAVIWQDARNGEFDPYVNVSADAGTSWLASDVRLDTGSVPGAEKSADPAVVVNGNTVVTAWEDWRQAGISVFANVSHDLGHTWSGEKRLDSGPIAAGWSRDPKLATCGTGVYCVWYDNRNDTSEPIFWDIYFNRSLDLGDSWLATDVQLDDGSGPGVSHSVKPEVVCSANTVGVAWPDARNDALFGAPYPFDIYFDRSLDQGTSWQGEVRLDTGDAPGNGTSSSSKLAVFGSDVFVAWQDTRNGKVDIYYQRSLDGGASWLAADRRLDTGDVPGLHASRYPWVAASAGGVWVAWFDERSGLADIYVNQPFAAVPYGSGKAGSGGIEPALASVGGGYLTIGGQLRLEVSQAVGGSFAGLLFGQGASDLAFLDATLHIAPIASFDFLFLQIGGAAGVAGAGSGNKSIALPLDSALIGLEVTTQALVYDPGVLPNPFSATNALALWIG